MKKIYSGIVLLFFVALLASCSSGSDADGEENYDLKMTVTPGESSSWYEAAEKFSKKVDEESDGRIEISVYANEELTGGDPGKGVESLSKGTKDLSYNSTIIHTALDEKLGVVSAPFLFNDYDEADKAMEGEGGDELKEILRDKGVETLAFGENGFRHLTNNKQAIESPEDLKNLKVRVPGINMYIDLWKELGADPNKMDFSEVFTSLQQGVIDGQENPTDIITSSKLYEVQDYLTDWTYSYDPLVLGMNKKTFDSMDSDDQEIMKQAAEEASEEQIEEQRQGESDDIETLEDEGMEVNELDDKQIEEFQNAVDPIYEKYKSVWGEDLLEKFQ